METKVQSTPTSSASRTDVGSAPSASASNSASLAADSSASATANTINLSATPDASSATAGADPSAAASAAPSSDPSASVRLGGVGTNPHAPPPEPTGLTPSGDMVDPSSLMNATASAAGAPAAAAPGATVAGAAPAPAPGPGTLKPPDLNAFRITDDSTLLTRQTSLSQGLSSAADVAAAATLIQGSPCTWTNWQAVAQTAAASQCMNGGNSLYVLYFFSQPQDGALKDQIGRATVQAGKGNLVYVNSTGSYTVGISKQYLGSVTVR